MLLPFMIGRFFRFSNCGRNNGFDGIGKLLWEGNFTSGSITVPGLSNYSIILVNVGHVYCIGDKYYGGNCIMKYGEYSISNYSYRVISNGDTLTIDSYNKGGSNGSEQVPILEIIGLLK